MPIGICEICKRSRYVLRNQKTGVIRCRSCADISRYRSRHSWEPCFICSKIRHVSIRIDGLNPICPNCYRLYYQPKRDCDECGEYSVATNYCGTGVYLCSKCRNIYRSLDESLHEVCIYCSRKRKVTSRDRNGMAICATCYSRITYVRKT